MQVQVQMLVEMRSANAIDGESASGAKERASATRILMHMQVQM